MQLRPTTLSTRPEVWLTLALMLAPAAAQAACNHGGFKLSDFSLPSHSQLRGTSALALPPDRAIDREPASPPTREPVSSQSNPFSACVHCDTDHGVAPPTVIPVIERLDLATESADEPASPPWARGSEGPASLYHLDAVCGVERPPR